MQLFSNDCQSMIDDLESAYMENRIVISRMER